VPENTQLRRQTLNMVLSFSNFVDHASQLELLLLRTRSQFPTIQVLLFYFQQFEICTLLLLLLFLVDQRDEHITDHRKDREISAANVAVTGFRHFLLENDLSTGLIDFSLLS
jgi:hypothetical protein